MSRVYTVCGLRRDQLPPQRWTGVCASVEADNGDHAVDLLDLDVRGDEAWDGGRLLVGRGLALSAVHLDDVPVEAEHREATLTLTRRQVERERGFRGDGIPRPWTFCGNDAKTWQALSYEVSAPTWLLAYVEWLDSARRDGYEPLFSTSHPGWFDRVGGYAYADRHVTDQAGMDWVVANEWETK